MIAQRSNRSVSLLKKKDVKAQARSFILGSSLLCNSAIITMLTSTPALAQGELVDKLQFDRYDRRVDAAAAYTEVLMKANAQLSYYIAATSSDIEVRNLTEADEQAFVSAVARAVETTGQPPAQGSQYELKRYAYAQMAGFDVAHRYCGGQLLSFFDTNDFKANLTVEQIQAAPELQSIREGRSYKPQMLYLLRTDGGTRALHSASGKTRRYDTCFDTLNGVSDPVPDGSLVTFRRAAVPFEVTLTRAVSIERRNVACPSGQVGYVQEIRETTQGVNAANKLVGDPVLGNWEVNVSTCYVPMITEDHEITNCPEGGMVRYKSYLVQANDPNDITKIIWVASDAAGNPVSPPVQVLDMQVGQCSAVFPPQKNVPTQSDVTTWETERPACETIYPGHGNLYGTYEHRRTRREATYFLANFNELITQVSYGPWERTIDSCYKLGLYDYRESRTLSCLTGFEGTHIQHRDLTRRTNDFMRPDRATVTNVTVTRNWYSTTHTCTPKPPPEPQRDDDNGYDVDGDGIPDFNNESQAQNYVDQHGGKVQPTSKECNGACNGPSGGSSGAGGGSASGGLGGWLRDLFGGNRGGGGGGSGSGSCFARGTRIRMKDGSLKRIEDIEVGDELASGGRVLAAMVFEGDALFDLRGTLVTGGHLVMHKGSWIEVRDHPEAIEIGLHPEVFGAHVYNLITEFNLIEIGGLLFADHAEVPVDALEEVLEASEHETVQDMPNARYLDALMDVDIPVSAKTVGISTDLLSPRSGGFGSETPMALEDGTCLEAKDLMPGMILAGGHRVTAIMRAKATWMVSLQHDGSTHSYSPASVIMDDARLDRADHQQGPLDVIYIATHDHKITTPHGVMADFWITEERAQTLSQRSAPKEEDACYG
jgi:hypothetical protein